MRRPEAEHERRPYAIAGDPGPTGTPILGTAQAFPANREPRNVIGCQGSLNELPQVAILCAGGGGGERIPSVGSADISRRRTPGMLPRLAGRDSRAANALRGRQCAHTPRITYRAAVSVTSDFVWGTKKCQGIDFQIEVLQHCKTVQGLILLPPAQIPTCFLHIGPYRSVLLGTIQCNKKAKSRLQTPSSPPMQSRHAAPAEGFGKAPPSLAVYCVRCVLEGLLGLAQPVREGERCVCDSGTDGSFEAPEAARKTCRSPGSQCRPRNRHNNRRARQLAASFRSLANCRVSAISYK